MPVYRLYAAFASACLCISPCPCMQALLAAINFLESCRRQEQQRAGPAGGLSPAAAASYLQLLENALLPTAPSELHAAALGAMLSVAAVQRAAFADAFAADGPRQQLLLRLLGHVDAGARQAAAQLLGLLVPHLGDGAAAGAAAAGQPQEQPRVAALCEPLLSMLRAGTAEGVKAAKQEQLEGAAAAAGYVAAHLIQGKQQERPSRAACPTCQTRLLLPARLLTRPVLDPYTPVLPLQACHPAPQTSCSPCSPSCASC